PEHRLYDRAVGGGALLDLGIYPLQLASLVLGTPDRVHADGVVGSTGVDEQVVALLHHPGDAQAVVKAAIRLDLASTARITGSAGWIELPAFMHCPTAITVAGGGRIERIDGAWEGDGLRFEVDEVHRCLAAGLLESRVVPWDESIALATTMDAIRAQLGVVYDVEQ
ncbi:MAG: Gfo/Idh/MocA family protein, partial [Actinomycetota bacterium]